MPAATGPSPGVGSTLKPEDKIRPYKCSQCGRRSNWKWDLSKHLRLVHPNSNAHMIILSEEEARATLGEVELPSKQTQAPQAPRKFERHKDYVKKLISGRFRPFKCSACGKRSNWKWDLGKHIKQYHNGAAEMLTLSEAEAKSEPINPTPQFTHKTPVQTPPFTHKTLVQSTVQNTIQSTVQNTIQTSVQSTVQNKNVALGQVLERPVQDPDQHPFACSLCSFTAKLKCIVVRHMNRSHGEGSTTMDNHMKTSFISPLSGVDLARTMQEHASSPGSTPTFSEQRKVRVYVCTHCEHRSNTRDEALGHFRVHSQNDIYACSLCERVTDYLYEIQQHVQQAHSKRVPDSFIQVRDCYTVSTYVQKEEISTATPPGDSFTSRYRCRLCPSKASATSRYSVVRHIQRSHRDMLDCKDQLIEKVEVSSCEQLSSASSEDRKPFQCNLCPYTATKNNQMKLHRAYHVPCAANRYKCRFCAYYVPTPRLLQYHHKLHTLGPAPKPVRLGPAPKPMSLGPAPTPVGLGLLKASGGAAGKLVGSYARRKTAAKFKCDKCPYMSGNKNDLLYHKQFHRPSACAPYKCEQCGYGTKDRRYLTLHMRVHAPNYAAAVEMGVVRNHSYQSLCAPLQAPPSTQQVPHSTQQAPPSSVHVSPAKSEGVESVSSEDAIQVAAIKHAIISSKIKHVPVTPQKVEVPARGSQEGVGQVLTKVVGDNREETCRYQSFYRCRYCPWSTVRTRNLRLHERMHGYREGKDLHKCPHCDYYVGNRGLLAQHIRVHSRQYQPGRDLVDDVESKTDETSKGILTELDQEESARRLSLGGAPIATPTKRPDYYIRRSAGSQPLLEHTQVKKWCCEKCPFATMKRGPFEKHTQLHGSRQRYVCQFCDYSVPGYHLLQQHEALHHRPNPHLLSVQSVANLTHLPDVPSDIALASGYRHDDEPQQKTFKEPDLFENSSNFFEPKKSFQCERCPYTTTRRDCIFTHMKFHAVDSAHKCPHCDYSVSKVPLLNQHIRLHFEPFGGGKSCVPEEEFQAKDVAMEATQENESIINNTPNSTAEVYEAVMEKDEDQGDSLDTVWLCQYCDIALHSVAKLKHHESLHMIGVC